ncbi:DAPG hydrolase family protein [Aquimarina addita]
MKLIGKIAVVFGTGILLVCVIIYLFDYRKPPASPSENWHAYLTEREQQHPLAKYWYKITKPDSVVLESLRKGPIIPSDMLAWENRLELSNPGYQKVENGWCLLEDGSGYVAVKTFFPNATAKMLDWWFVWAQQKENIRYKIWYPGAHYSMAEIDTPNTLKHPNGKENWGKSRFPVEDVGLGVSQIRLDFVPPDEFGFNEEPDSTSIVTVRVGLANGLFKHTDMIHYIRPVKGGVEMRSRFWMARDLEPMSGGLGLAAFLADNQFIKRRAMPSYAPKELAFHCATEYSQLAGFLPELYAVYGPKN